MREKLKNIITKDKITIQSLLQRPLVLVGSETGALVAQASNS